MFIAMNKKWLVLVLSSTLIFASLHFSSTVARAASLNNTSVTMSNSRFSFKAGSSSGTSGSSLITIGSSGFPDNNTNHLFPGNTVCFADAGQNGCIGSTNYKVSNIIDSTHFNLTTPLSASVDTSGYVVATESGTWTVAFTTVSAIPNGGSILITIPMADNANGNDGIPDSGSSILTGGFDLNKLIAGNIAITGCTQANFGTPVVTAGATTVDHTISIPRNTASCAAGTAIVITIGGNGIVNPAPITSGHTQGTADVYGITVATRDYGNNIIDNAIPRAAPVEAVLVSANVDESLSLVVAGLAPGTYCGKSQTITTTATSIPWGHIAAANTFYYAAQTLTVNTNAASGYAVTIQENDQMGKNGNTCTGTAPSSGDYTFGTSTCIRDTVCNGTSACSETTSADWTIPTGFAGLGYTEASMSGTDAPFFYNEMSRTWSSKQLPDVAQGGKTAQTVMGNSGPVNNSQIYLCYTITIPGTQPSGYYYNIVKYTATATF